MKISILASRYSKALFYVAATPEQLKKRLYDVERVAHLIATVPKLKHFILSPQIGYASKSFMLNEIGKSIQADTPLINFLMLLLKKGRFIAFPEIAAAYSRRVKEHLELLDATLITAVPVSPLLKAKLKGRLEKFYSRKVTIEEKVDPQIVGGATLVVFNRMIDFSIKNRPVRLREKLLSISV